MGERARFESYLLVVLLLLVATFGCGGEANGPAAAPVVTDGQFHPVRFAASSAPLSKGTAGTAGTSQNQSGDVVFWAYTDRDASVSVNQVLPDGSTQPYATFTVPRGSLFRRPDGTPFGFRDSIAITLTPDTQELRVNLEPTGLVFNPLIPARLSISYQSANP